jgi:hypothetical protein
MSDSAPLPGVLEEIADVAGRPTAIVMALAWGGREIHIGHQSRRQLCPGPCDPRGRRNHRQLEEALQASRPTGKLCPQLRAGASRGRPVAPAQSRPTGIRAILASTPADPI